MIDHLGISIQDLQKSKEFYLKALKPLGYGIVMEFETAVGFGPKGKPAFWIAPGKASGHVHVALIATTRAQVDAFYEAALQAGGRDNGKPGLRAHYHPDYYGAFVFDPDGNNIEAVCHQPA